MGSGSALMGTDQLSELSVVEQVAIVIESTMLSNLDLLENSCVGCKLNLCNYIWDY